ncbi:HAD family hydrolase [Flavivirga amylovorans]|uniref:HAD family hydrolase n=1 Tax=Flavivirga amylovorans TaxID=870486 RepID=A0ABT8X1Y8_9FLAO|nr:HAD family hydrolase [Flavivirga amylovorans]MDO5987944.1 HAD family hydrolase [Flavivirga amylovorans]
MKTKKIVVFDLDDTLYNEIDYLKSAFNEIAVKISNKININKDAINDKMLDYFYSNKNVFLEIIKAYNLQFTVEELLSIYRKHQPNISLSEDRISVLNNLKKANIDLALLTDGRSIQQRSKIRALRLNRWFSEIVISEEFGSEKPNINNYKHFEKMFGEGVYYYVGDNIGKDFVSPNKLNWTTICLKNNGLNIHKQDEETVNEEYFAQKTITEFLQLKEIINQ